MIILGIDPGTATTGYAVLQADVSSELAPVLLDTNTLKTPPEMDMHTRLHKLYNDLNTLIVRYSPKIMVIERLFFNTNARTAMTVGQARGVVLLAAASNNLEVKEYTALEAKKVVTGYGRASKKEMQEAVRKIMQLKEIVRSDDANDALAIVICHMHKTASFSFTHHVEATIL